MTGSPYSGRSHQDLADLVKELFLAGHLIDRAGMPHLIALCGKDAMAEVAIGEWMAASPIYTRRMQLMLGFEGDTVETIFKGMQLDIGAPPEFMDFRYAVTDDNHGGFHLAHCGALMDVEPMGDDYVTTMCHDIEDPTFDATAAATNPRAQVRPIHRPPRVPANQHPHCSWTVTIDGRHEPVVLPETILATSGAALMELSVSPPDLASEDGWNDYAKPLDAELRMEQFSSACLARIADEACLQGHLLSRAFLLEVTEQTDAQTSKTMGGRQLCGIAGVTAKRLSRWMGAPADLGGVAQVLALHPMLAPATYVASSITVGDDGILRFSLGACPATAEPDGLTWPSILIDTDDRGLHAAVAAVDPQARVERVHAASEVLATWEIVHDDTLDPIAPFDEVTLTEFSTGSTFQFATG